VRRTVWALFRASWLTATSYRLQTVMTLLTLWVTVVPVYFLATALQPTMAAAIRDEGRAYFPFMLTGVIAISLVSVCVTAVPSAVQSGIGSGFLESLLATRAPRSALVVGLGSYPIAWGVLRAVLMLVAGVALGARWHVAGIPLAAAIAMLVVVVHWAIGLVAAAMIVAWRTAGPLTTAVVVASTLLGGAYYPTQVIPSWIQQLAVVVPLQYGLRAFRQVLFGGADFAAVWRDVLVLATFAVALTAIGYGALLLSLRYARRRGSLSHF
jgi:ABC-2 type transport system permease protein